MTCFYPSLPDNSFTCSEHSTMTQRGGCVIIGSILCMGKLGLREVETTCPRTHSKARVWTQARGLLTWLYTSLRQGLLGHLSQCSQPQAHSQSWGRERGPECCACSGSVSFPTPRPPWPSLLSVSLYAPLSPISLQSALCSPLFLHQALTHCLPAWGFPWANLCFHPSLLVSVSQVSVSHPWLHPESVGAFVNTMPRPHHWGSG